MNYDNYDNTKPSTQNNPPKEDPKNKDGQADHHAGDEQKKEPYKPGTTQPEQKKM